MVNDAVNYSEYKASVTNEWMSVEHWWNHSDILTGSKRSTGQKICPRATALTTSLTWTGLGLKPGPSYGPRNTVLGWHNSMNRKITNIFQHTNLCITFCSPNTLFNLLKTPKENVNKYMTSGTYCLNVTCVTKLMLVRWLKSYNKIFGPSELCKHKQSKI